MALGASDLNIIIKATDQASATMKGVAKEAGGMGGALGGVARIAGGIAVAGIAAAGTAAVGLGLALFDCTKEAMAAQEVQAQLNAVLASTGGAAGVTAQAANDLATALSQVTRFDDETILSAEALLLTFTNINSKAFPEATQAALDMSTAMGQDLNSSILQIGKALNDPITGMTALQRVGVAFTEDQKEQIKTLAESGDLMGAQKIILAELSKEFGGSAAAAGATFAGQMDILNNTVGNLKETVGTALLPALTTLAGTLTEALNKPEVQAAVTKLAESLGKFVVDVLPPLVDFLANSVIPAMVTLMGILGGGGGTGLGLSQAFADAAAFVQPVTDALGPLMAALGQLEAVISPILLPALQALADIFTNVILPVMGAQFMNMLSTVIGMFAGFLTFLTGAVEMIVGLFTGDMDKARGSAQKVMEGILGIFRAMVNGIIVSVTNIVNAVIGAFEQLGIDIVTPVQTVIDEIVNAFNTLPATLTQIGTDLINGLKKGISDAAQSVVDTATGVVDDVVGGITDFLGIQSPSKVFHGIGVYIVEGLRNGIADTASEAVAAIRDLGGSLVEGLNQGIADKVSSMVSAVKEMVNVAHASAQITLLAHSPSQLFVPLGQSIGLGLIQGIQATRAAVSSTVKATVNDTFKEWWAAIKSNLGVSGNSNIRRMFQDWMRDWLATATVGVSEMTGDLVARMLADARAAFGPGVASILQQFSGSWQSILGSAGGLPAGGAMFGVVDAIMGAAGRLSGVGSTAAERYNRQVIDPLREELRILEEQGGNLEQIAAFKEQIAKEEAKIFALQQQQADLQWLGAQLDLIKLIKENGLNAAAILGDLTFGLGADPAAILDAMTAAMQQMLAQAQSTFTGFGVAIADAIPEWLVPGSPTAFEMGLRGIGRAMDSLALPALSPAYAGGGWGGSVVVNYSPVFSAVDAHEAEYKLKPLIEAAVRKVMR